MDFDMFNIPVINLDHYSALGLKREDDPSIDDIQNAYRHLALQWHPERNKTSSKRETASLKFIEINEAYKFLMDKKLREAKQAAKAAKSKKPERALSPIGRATSPGPISPTGRSKSRPRWSAAASRLVSGMHGSSQSDTTVGTEEIKPATPKLEEPLPEPEPPRSSIAPSRSTIASPPATHLSAPLSVAPRHPSAPPSREPSPALPGAYAPSSAGRSTASWITTHIPTRAYPEAQDSRASSVRSPPAIYTVNEDVPTRQPRYLRAMSELGLTDVGSVSGSGSVSGGYASSVISGSSATTNIPDDWLFPIYLTLEDLYTCKTHRFRINRHLLNGSSKEVFVDVSVQPNWRDGTQLRCKGLGNEREGQPPQDVIFVVKEKLHPRFLRDPMGYDIYARLEVSLVIALGGGSTNDEALLIKGVDGSEIVVEVPPPVVRHGSMTRIKGAGMPKYKSKDGSVPLRGDLILEWCVLPPDKELSEEAMSELREALGDSWLRDEVDE